MMMAEYTDLQCDSPDIAEAVLRYLNEQQDGQEETPDITAYINKSTLRVTYGESENRREWDMQLMGFRDGLTLCAPTVPPVPVDWMHIAATRALEFMNFDTSLSIVQLDIKDVAAIIAECAPAIPPPGSDKWIRETAPLCNKCNKPMVYDDSDQRDPERCESWSCVDCGISTEVKYTIPPPSSDHEGRAVEWIASHSARLGVGGICADKKSIIAALAAEFAALSAAAPAPVGSDAETIAERITNALCGSSDLVKNINSLTNWGADAIKTDEGIVERITTGLASIIRASAPPSPTADARTDDERRQSAMALLRSLRDVSPEEAAEQREAWAQLEGCLDGETGLYNEDGGYTLLAQNIRNRATDEVWEKAIAAVKSCLPQREITTVGFCNGYDTAKAHALAAITAQRDAKEEG